MNRIAAATLALAFALTGCTGSPKANLTPQAPPTPAHYIPLEPEPAESPEPAPTAPGTIPGTNLTAGPKPGTALGPTGMVLDLVPTDPNRRFECRTLTGHERRALSTLMHGDPPPSKMPAPTAADITDSASVVVWWETYETADGTAYSTNAMVTNGKRFANVHPGKGVWPGTHSHIGLAFADGPKALAAARECVTAGVDMDADHIAD